MSVPRRIHSALAHGLIDPGQARSAFADSQARAGELDAWSLAVERGGLTREQVVHIARIADQIRLVSESVDGYRLQRRIAKGGMGEIYLGCHPERGTAAIKVLPSSLMDAEHLGRFAREAAALLELDHHHIVHSFGHGFVDGHPYIMMSYIDGPSLATVLEEHGPISEDLARLLLVQGAEALDHAWAHGFVHRDVKPSNILLAPPRSGVAEVFCIKLCDFGLVSFRPGLPRDYETGRHQVLGTLRYMSPEQMSGDSRPDPRHDIYGLGATVAHALLGRPLYFGAPPEAWSDVTAQHQAYLDRLSSGTWSPALVALLRDMMASRRDERIAEWTTVMDRSQDLPTIGEPNTTRRIRNRRHDAG